MPLLATLSFPSLSTITSVITSLSTITSVVTAHHIPLHLTLC